MAAAPGDLSASGGKPEEHRRGGGNGVGGPGWGLTKATMAGMASCARCGSDLPAAARFCPTCGRPVDPEFGPPAPPDAPPIWSGYRPPGWLTADWALVGLGVVVMLWL